MSEMMLFHLSSHVLQQGFGYLGLVMLRYHEVLVLHLLSWVGLWYLMPSRFHPSWPWHETMLWHRPLCQPRRKVAIVGLSTWAQQEDMIGEHIACVGVTCYANLRKWNSVRIQYMLRRTHAADGFEWRRLCSLLLIPWWTVQNANAFTEAWCLTHSRHIHHREVWRPRNRCEQRPEQARQPNA